MIHLQGTERLFISEDLIGYADKLTRDGVFPRRLDLLLLGFSYAVTNRLPPTDDVKRHELTRAVSLDDVQIPVEAVAHWYAREIDQGELKDESALLDFICRVGVAGAYTLQDRWQGRSTAVATCLDWIFSNTRRLARSSFPMAL